MSEAPAAISMTLSAGRSVRWPLLAVLLVFALSRAGYYLAGLRFDASPLPWFWQFADPALLKANLGQSIWYLHSQPPAFNLFLGIVLHLFPGHEIVAFAFCYLLLGIGFAVTLFLLLRGLGVSDILSAGAAALYVASPTCALYENWLFYAYPVTVLLLLAALFWQRSADQGRFGDMLALFVSAAMLALTWSLFHLAWLLTLVLALLLARRGDWRKVLSAAAVPVLIVVFWYCKNLVQVGQFTGSTWMGMSLSRMTDLMLTKAERGVLRDNGTISAISMVMPFSPLERYGTGTSSAGVPILDQEVKMSGAPNFNNRRYADISHQYGRDALNIMRLRPVAYLQGLVGAYAFYFRPASRGAFLKTNTARLGPAVLPVHAGFLFLVYGVALLAVPFFLLRHLQSRTQRRSMMFLWYNAVWITVVANAVEVVENNRFRFTADPLVFVSLVVVAVTQARRVWPGHGAGGPATLRAS